MASFAFYDHFDQSDSSVSAVIEAKLFLADGLQDDSLAPCLRVSSQDICIFMNLPAFDIHNPDGVDLAQLLQAKHAKDSAAVAPIQPIGGMAPSGAGQPEIERARLASFCGCTVEQIDRSFR